MTTDTHTLRAAILRALSVAPRNMTELGRCMSAHATSVIARTVETLSDEGLVALKWGRFRLTRTGRLAIPSMSALPPMVPYRSPAVVRRPGSDHSHIPSLAGGRLIRRDA
jgi:hypothetical protein